MAAAPQKVPVFVGSLLSVTSMCFILFLFTFARCLAFAVCVGFCYPPQSVRRDRLVAIEAAVQAQWAANKSFELDAPAADAPDANQPKFLATFPYPYMNGMHPRTDFLVPHCRSAHRAPSMQSP